MSCQTILDENGQPIFAVIPYSEYNDLVSNKTSKAEATSYIKYINIPNGGPNAKIDLLSLVRYVSDSGILAIPICNRAKKLNEFSKNEIFSMEVLVRTQFAENSYRNTMQMVSNVTNDLVKTGLFKTVKLNSLKLSDSSIYNADNLHNTTRYSRAVNCLQPIYSSITEFLKSKKDDKSEKIINDYWYKNI